MLLHNLKIAFRNMWKYKSQTLISVIGLAVGFTCFALATLWIVYEMTYDNFHKNAKQMYAIYIPQPSSQIVRGVTPAPLAAYLKETFPEIANATATRMTTSTSQVKLTEEGAEFQIRILTVDSSFVQMFDVKIIEGNMDFLTPITATLNTIYKYAITQEKARLLFGNESPLGKVLMRPTIIGTHSYGIICAVVTELPKHSNYSFDLLQAGRLDFDQRDPWIFWNSGTVIELHRGTNVEAFRKRLYEVSIDQGRDRFGRDKISGMTIKPLTEIYYTDPDIPREVKFQYIFIFAISGLLVVLCSLFNYLTLFLSRFRMRQKEMALRMVCGASGFSLLVMLSVEFLLTLLFAVVFGGILIQIAHKPFLMMSEIQMNMSAIYSKSFMYIAGVILVALLAFWLILFIFRRRSLNVSIRSGNKKLFRKISVIVQLMISVGFAFCTIVILKQMYFLHNSGELGFSLKNRGSVQVWGENIDVMTNQLKQIPEITEVVDATGGLMQLIPQSRLSSRDVSSWDDKPANVEIISLDMMFVSPEYAAFYDLQLVAGEMLTDSDSETLVLINETAAKAFGWHDPVGKHFDGRYRVKGVIKDILNFAPTVQATPIFYLKRPPGYELVNMGSHIATTHTRVILFKYRNGMWKTLMEKIEQLTDDRFDVRNIFNAEEEYNKFLKSENVLMKLLSFVSVICVLICVFGFVSLVSLTCEERRKEIAIRKINGATAGNILAMFAKEYFMLLVIGAAIAFTTGYFIMQRWLEQYAIQTSIPAWIYLSITCALALVIVLCVGWQVYRVSIENPAEVVKSK